ncbi:MAG: hypothetical protein ABL940_06495 [Bacteroidia bacterium]
MKRIYLFILLLSIIGCSETIPDGSNQDIANDDYSALFHMARFANTSSWKQIEKKDFVIKTPPLFQIDTTESIDTTTGDRILLTVYSSTDKYPMMQIHLIHKSKIGAYLEKPYDVKYDDTLYFNNIKTRLIVDDFSNTKFANNRVALVFKENKDFVYAFMIASQDEGFSKSIQPLIQSYSTFKLKNE